MPLCPVAEYCVVEAPVCGASILLPFTRAVFCCQAQAAPPHPLTGGWKGGDPLPQTRAAARKPRVKSTPWVQSASIGSPEVNDAPRLVVPPIQAVMQESKTCRPHE